MNLVALPAYTDNYIWLLHDGRQAVVVDPGAAAPVVEALRQADGTLAGILVTHHHGDHTGGVAELLARFPRARVWGPAHETLPHPALGVAQGDRLDVLGRPALVLDVPGHTAGHVAYVLEPESASPVLFCGDTLFSAGCGRLFEGSPAQLAASLARLNAWPAATRVCCAHEYTLANLAFAAAVEPGNEAVQAYLARARALRERGEPTLPSTLALERQINPFLRCAEAAVQAAAAARGADASDPVAVLATLRAWKNDYR